MVGDRDRLVGLDLLRGGAVLLMVFGHCVSWGRYGASLPLYNEIGWALSGFRMPMLILISGMLAHGMLRADWSRVRGRLAHFGWIYTVWMPVSLVVTLYVLGPVPPRVGVDTFAAEYVRPLTVMWFIWVLAILTGSLYALRGLPRRWVAIGAMTVSVGGYAIDPVVFSHANLLRYAGFFFVGALYRDEAMWLLTRPFSWKLMAALVAVVIPLHLVAAALRTVEGWQVLGVPERFVLGAIGLHGVQLLYRTPIAAPLARLGRRTLPVFVTHLPILLLARTLLPDLGGVASVMAPLLLAAVSVGASLAIERIAIGMGADWLYARPAWARRATMRRGVEQLAVLLARGQRPAA